MQVNRKVGAKLSCISLEAGYNPPPRCMALIITPPRAL